MTDYGKAIGERIRNARKKKQITQERLAERIGIKRATLSKYETGIIQPSLDMLFKLSDTLEVPLLEILPLAEFSNAGYMADLFRPNEPEEDDFLLNRMKELFSALSIDGQRKDIERAEDWILGYTFTNDEIELINNYHALNDLGKVKARERVEDLTEITRYQKAPLQDEAQSGDASKEGEGS